LDLNGSPTDQQKHEHLEKRPRKRDAANVPEDDEYGSYPDDVDELEALLNNKSGEKSIHSKTSIKSANPLIDPRNYNFTNYYKSV